MALVSPFFAIFVSTKKLIAMIYLTHIYNFIDCLADISIIVTSCITVMAWRSENFREKLIQLLS